MLWGSVVEWISLQGLLRRQARFILSISMVDCLLQVGQKHLNLHRERRDTHTADLLQQTSPINEWTSILLWMLWCSMVEWCSLKIILSRSTGYVSMVVFLLLLGWKWVQRERRESFGIDHN